MHGSKNVKQYVNISDSKGILRSECGDTRWRTGGERRGNWRTEWVASTLTLPRNVVYPALLTLMRTPRLQSSRLNWLPRRFKWTRPFRRKTRCGFCACAIRFRTSSTRHMSLGDQGDRCLRLTTLRLPIVSKSYEPQPSGALWGWKLYPTAIHSTFIVYLYT